MASHPAVRTVGWQRNATCMHTAQKLIERFRHEGGANYLDHAAESLRGLEIITCFLKQRTRHITAEPHPSIRVSLKGLIDPVDAIACFLDLKMSAPKQCNT